MSASAPLLCVSDEMIEELEMLRREYGWRWARAHPLEKGRIINKVASILNRFWGSDIEPYLRGKPWRDPMKFLQDIIGDESKGEHRAVSQWLQGIPDTRGFIKHIAFIVQSYLKAH
ncbi:MAG: hypothetical protein QXZ02_02840 [Candidatus Bathyarchaeia archaeon]